MANVVVVYHSGYGHTQRVAQQVAQGADAELLAIDADGNLAEGGWETLAAADAIIFGTPTYMGGPSWQFKKFADTSSKAWFSRGWQDKVFGGFTASASLNGDKGACLIQLQTLASQHGGLWVSLGMVAFLIPATLFGLKIGAAVVFHEGSTLLVVANALRLLGYKDKVA